jgi:hypothetical protein
MEEGISQMDETDNGSSTVPFDYGERARIAKARSTISRMKSRSPVAIFGKDAIRRLAAEISGRRSKSHPEVPACRLALALRRPARTAAYLANGSTIALGRANDSPVETSDKPSERLPDAETAKAARKKLVQAQECVDKLNSLLGAEEVRAFRIFASEALENVRKEILETKEAILVPMGLRRGRPSISLLVALLYGELKALAGNSLRGPRDDADREKYITDTLFTLCSQLLEERARNGLVQVIGTVVKKGKPRE